MSEDQEAGLAEEDLAATWIEQFGSWHEQARAAGLPEPDAMVLGTAAADGTPSARTVLLKGVDVRGFEFFTNYDSRKGRELAENPRASLLFPWYALQRQVIVTGSVVVLDAGRSEEYFASRGYGSKIGALASKQSSVIADRSVLERERDLVRRRYPEGGAVPRPERWGGFRVCPQTVEFWQGRRDRLHDRLRFRRVDREQWLVERLSP
jgi:pyridoxamine 5'-phosphate oxidase